MAQTTNISNSADSQSIIRLTMSSEDEDYINNHHHFSTPSLDMNFSAKNDVVNQCLTVENQHHDSDSISTDLSQSTTINIPTYHTYENLSASSSEASLVRPLLNEKQQDLPIYETNINNISPTSSNQLLTSSYCSYIKFYLTDMLMSAFIITPLVNIHWRGGWDLLDIYLLSNYERTSAFVSVAIGLMILYVVYLIQNILQKFYEKRRQHIIGYFMTRFYTLIVALAYINQWRGLWSLLDLTSNMWYHLVIETLISVILLALMKSLYSLNSAPFLIGVDTEAYFILGSKCTVSTKNFWQYTFDFIFYELVEAPLVVIAWRGLYNLSDLYIYPDNKLLSMLVSFTVGYAIFFLLALLQIPIIQCFVKHQHHLLHSLVSNLFQLLAFISVVQIWRSLWMICEQYINIPGYNLATLGLCYIGAFVILTCGLTACSLNGPGGGKDNYVDEQTILLWKFDYFSTLLKTQSSNSGIKKGVLLGSDAPSVETIMPAECQYPYQFKPP